MEELIICFYVEKTIALVEEFNLNAGSLKIIMVVYIGNVVKTLHTKNLILKVNNI